MLSPKGDLDLLLPLPLRLALSTNTENCNFSFNVFVYNVGTELQNDDKSDFINPSRI